MSNTGYKYFQHVCFLLALLLPFETIADDLILEVIPLKHRLLSDVLPIVQPLVVDGGIATGMNDQLVVKTTAGNMAEIKRLLDSLDTAPRRLMIYVSQDIDGNLTRNEHGLSGRLKSGDVTIESPDVGRGNGASIEIGDGDGSALRYRSLTSRSVIEDHNTHMVQTIEGQPAFIATGQSVPIANQRAFVSGNGVILQNGVEYRDVSSGFYVIPRLSGDRVTLLIAPRLEKMSPQQGGQIDIQSVETTASGRLGEWIHIGGSTQQFKDRNTRNLASTRERGQELRSIYLRVDEIQ